MMDSEENSLKSVILNSKTPLLFKKYLNNDILKWNLDDWKQILANEQLEFRSGVNAFTKEPQWERFTQTVKGTFEDFLNVSAEHNSEKWLYFDYKYLNQWLTNVAKLRNLDLGLKELGFPSVTADDYTLWIGTKGAHTPCHIDTYGCNLVFQIYGKKQWLLFPPTENLKPTRIPYEESSIYSQLNFFSPNLDEFKHIKNAKSLILSPGDVLLVPHKWWHYVENVETAISINIWLPLPVDNIERLEECIVQHYIAQITSSMCEKENTILLNPNMNKELLANASPDLIATCVNICLKDNCTPLNFPMDKTLETFHFISTVETLSNEQFHTFLQTQRTRFHNKVNTNIKLCDKFIDMIKIIKAVTNPEVVTLTRKKLLEQYSE